MEPDRPRPPSAGPPPSGDPFSGLTAVRVVSLERVPIRTREGITTRSAWRLVVASEQGEGTISLIEISPTVSLYRGEGVFLGWPSDELQAAYRTFLPRNDEPDADLPQLG